MVSTNWEDFFDQTPKKKERIEVDVKIMGIDEEGLHRDFKVAIAVYKDVTGQGLGEAEYRMCYVKFLAIRIFKCVSEGDREAALIFSGYLNNVLDDKRFPPYPGGDVSTN